MDNTGDTTQNPAHTDSEWRRYVAAFEFYEQIKDGILKDAEDAGMSQKQMFRLELGVEEIAANIIRYAYKDTGYIFVHTEADGERFRLEFADHGAPFNPLEQKMKHGKVPTDEQEEGGYGIFLVKKNFSSIVYRHEELFGNTANHLIMELPLL